MVKCFEPRHRTAGTRRFLDGVSYAALAAAFWAGAVGVSAQDVTIDTEETDPVRTSEAIGTGEGTITITVDGSILVDGTPLIIDGPHNLVLEGLVQSNASADAIGIFVDTSDLRLTSDIDISGDVVLRGPDLEDIDAAAQSDLTGILFAGANGFEGNLSLGASSNVQVDAVGGRGLVIATPFQGDITINGGSVVNNSLAGGIVVAGEDGIAVELQNTVTGDLSIGGRVLGTGENGQGLVIRDSVSGRVTLAGLITSGSSTGTQVTNQTLVNSGGDAVVINGSITGGLLLDGAGQDNSFEDPNTDVTQGISAVGQGAGLVISNTSPSDGPLVIGTLEGEEFGFISRQQVVANGIEFGLSATAIRIGGGAGGAVSIEGGLLFDGGNAVTSAVDGDAIALDIASGADLSRIVLEGDDGGLAASTFVSGSPDEDNSGEIIFGSGGDATGLFIREGASVVEVVNEAIIGTIAGGEGSQATSVLDASGTLASLINRGEIEAVAGSNSPAEPIAIDVRANTTGFSLINEGTVSGQVLLGSGDDVIELRGGDIEGAVDFGLGANRLDLIGDAGILGNISFGGTLDVAVTDSQVGLEVGSIFQASNVTLFDGSSILAQVDPETGSSGLLQIDNQLIIDANIPVDIELQSFTVSDVSFVLVDAGSILGGENKELEVTTDLFLFDTILTTEIVDGRSQVVLNLSPVSAGELGLSEQFAQVYENVQIGLEPDPFVEFALANLSSAEEVEQALADISPDFTNRLFEAALANQRTLNRNFSERLDDFLGGDGNPGGTWAVEHGSLGTFDNQNPILDSNYVNVGLSVGYTGRFTENLAFGFGGGFSLFGSETRSGFGSNISVFAPYITSYLIGNAGPFYAGLSGTATLLDIERDRRLGFVDGDPLITSSSQGLTLAGTAEVGANFKLGGLRLKPYGTIAVNDLTEDGYSESGGSVAQEVSQRSVGFVEGGGGLSLSYDIILEKSRYGTRILRPEIYGGLSRLISGDNSASFDARFLESERSLQIDGDLLNQNAEFAGAAVSLFGTGSVARIRYQYEDRGLLTSHSATLNFKLVF